MKLHIFRDGRWVEKGKGRLKIVWAGGSEKKAHMVITRESVMTLMLNSVVNNVCLEPLKESKKHVQMYVTSIDGEDSKVDFYLITGKPFGIAKFLEEFSKLKQEVGGITSPPPRKEVPKIAKQVSEPVKESDTPTSTPVKESETTAKSTTEESKTNTEQGEAVTNEKLDDAKS